MIKDKKDEREIILENVPENFKDLNKSYFLIEHSPQLYLKGFR